METASPTALKELQRLLQVGRRRLRAGDGDGDAASDQDGRVRHDPDDARLAAESGLEAAEREPGRDRDEQLPRVHLGADLFQEPGHGLRLHGQEDRLRLADQEAVVPGRLDLVEALHPSELGVHGVAGPHVVRLELAGLEHAFEQRPSHVSGTHEADLLHEPSPPRTVGAARIRGLGLRRVHA
jgi:hypothetical protein